ncbi:MAG: T9SS type A sorting domain-containing protein, partial [Flavipsychrobacter sp.]
YNASNKITADSIYVYTGASWRMIAKSYYAYDASGNLITIDTYADSVAPLREKLKYVNTYDAGKRLLTVQASYFDGTNLVPYVKDTFGYSGALIYSTSGKEYQYDGINHYWSPYFYMIKQLNTLSLPDTIYIKGWDSVLNNWVPQTMEIASYDTFKLPVRLMNYQFDGTMYPSLASTITTYYYQRFNDNTGMTDIHDLHNVKIYPNPTSDKVNITIDQLQVNTPVSILLYNTNGQLIRSLRTVWQQYGLQMPLADISPGIYWLSIQDDNGGLIQRQALVKK